MNICVDVDREFIFFYTYRLTSQDLTTTCYNRLERSWRNRRTDPSLSQHPHLRIAIALNKTSNNTARVAFPTVVVYVRAMRPTWTRAGVQWGWGCPNRGIGIPLKRNMMWCCTQYSRSCAMYAVIAFVVQLPTLHHPQCSYKLCGPSQAPARLRSQHC